MKKIVQNDVVIYQTKTGAIELKGDFGHETIWASQIQIANIFSVDRTVVTKHIGNILRNHEIDEKRNVQKMHIPNSDKLVTFYSLDLILTVGYRANSPRAIVFRQWATKILHEHITKGFTINRNRISKNYDMFVKAVDDDNDPLIYTWDFGLFDKYQATASNLRTFTEPGIKAVKVTISDGHYQVVLPMNVNVVE